MIIGKAAGIGVIGLWGQFIRPRFLDCGYCYIVFPASVDSNIIIFSSKILYKTRHVSQKLNASSEKLTASSEKPAASEN
jgi:hypothetical protein